MSSVTTTYKCGGKIVVIKKESSLITTLRTSKDLCVFSEMYIQQFFHDNDELVKSIEFEGRL